jgi:hypothetical protein
MSHQTKPARKARAVTLDADLPNIQGEPPRGLYVGTTGDVNLLAADDTTAVLHANVQGGSVLPISVRRVLASGTTATGFVAYY